MTSGSAGCMKHNTAWHRPATLMMVKMHASPLCAEGAATAGVEILSKLAGMFKPLQITLEICCGKQSQVFF